MEIGVKGYKEEMVVSENTAATMGSGLLPVYATPCMLALMEGTAAESVAPFLEEGCGTVGTRLDVAHVAATPIGMKVHCETELIEVDRKRLVFKVQAFDEVGLIGEGTHERFIISNDKFMEKVQAKMNR